MKTPRIFALTLLLAITTTLLPATAQANGQWGLPEGAKLRLGKGRITEIEFSPDGKLLAVASAIGVWLYDVPTFNEIALLTGHTTPVTNMSFSLDGQTLASVDDGSTSRNGPTICLWDVTTGTLLKTLPGHTDFVSSVHFSPDEHTLASGSHDGTVLLWDIAPDTGR